MARTPAAPPPPEESAFAPAPAPASRIGEVADGAAYSPTDGTLARGGTPVPTMGPVAPFALVFHPHRWTVLAGRVVPAFKRLKYIAGVNGVDQRVARDGSRTPVVGPARAAAEERGEVVIPLTAIPAAHQGRADLHQSPRGTAPPSYLWRPRGRPDVHLMIYERVYPGSDDIECDVVPYLEFCEALRTEYGLVPHPPAHVLRRMLERAEEAASKAAEIATRLPHMAAVAKRLADDAAVIAASLEASAEARARVAASGDAVAVDA